MVRRLPDSKLGGRDTARLVGQIRQQSRPLRSSADLEHLLDRIGDARVVLLGEASHGTADYYTWRAAISKRLIEEKGFNFIAVEGDWPDCYEVNRFVRHFPDTPDEAHDALGTFRRWPTWMWANEEIAELTRWLRGHNDGAPEAKRAGFYGLDVYSLWDSLYAVLGYVRRHRPDAFPAALKAFRCFEPYGEDVQDYARATRWVPTSCEDEVVDLLNTLRSRGKNYPHDGREADFSAEQNALVLKNAEAYYRAMIQGGPESWNVRDMHMMDTLEGLLRHHGPSAKAIVWEHNTHIGDARYTDMAEEGMVNIGQLARQGLADAGVVLVGFGSYEGTVIAGREWEASMERMTVPAGREGSWESVLHEAAPADQLLVFDPKVLSPEMLEWRGHRAIGVVYNPEYERYGNYVPTVLPRRYDAFIFVDQSAALHPLPVRPREEAELPETYPTGV